MLARWSGAHTTRGGSPLRDYEILYIVRPDLEEDEVNQAVERVNALIANVGGTPSKTDVWGKRRLAYEVDHLREGYYVLTDFQVEPERVPELESTLKISDTVFRHLIVRKPAKAAAAAPAEAKAPAADGEAPAAPAAETPAAQAAEGAPAAEAPAAEAAEEPPAEEAPAAPEAEEAEEAEEPEEDEEEDEDEDEDEDDDDDDDEDDEDDDESDEDDDDEKEGES